MEMKHKVITLFLLAAGMMPTGLLAEPSSAKKPDVVWSKNMNSGTGLYSRSRNGSSHAIFLELDAAYYYGDVENRGLAVAMGPLFAENIGGIARIGYVMPVNSIVGIRYSLGGGMLRGNNYKYADQFAGSDTPLAYRQFESWMVNGAVGAEFYPVPNSGFYLYVGVMLNYSHISFDYNDPLYSGTNNSFLPMIPIEIGYQFHLGKGWRLNAHLGLAQGLLDTENCSLDGFPHVDGNISMSQSANRMADGWFNVGIAISYSWQRCETCRISRY